MRAFQAAERWVREWRVPSDDEGWSAAAPAVEVALRLGGRALARETAEASADGDALREAVGAALAAAEARLPIERDALYAERLHEAAGQVAVSVEMAGELTPIGELELGQSDRTISPGLDGIAASLGSRWAFVFPSAFASGDLTYALEMSAIGARLLGEPALGLQPATELAANHGVTYYRFRSVHVAQLMPGGPAVFLHRGGRVVDEASITTESLREFADRLAGHLESRLLTGPERLGISGTTNPTRSASRLAPGTPLQQAMAALALERHSRARGVEPERAARSARLAARILDEGVAARPGDIDVIWVYGYGWPAWRGGRARPSTWFCSRAGGLCWGASRTSATWSWARPWPTATGPRWCSTASSSPSTAASTSSPVGETPPTTTSIRATARSGRTPRCW